MYLHKHTCTNTCTHFYLKWIKYTLSHKHAYTHTHLYIFNQITYKHSQSWNIIHATLIHQWIVLKLSALATPRYTNKTLNTSKSHSPQLLPIASMDKDQKRGIVWERVWTRLMSTNCIQIKNTLHFCCHNLLFKQWEKMIWKFSIKVSLQNPTKKTHSSGFQWNYHAH